jgi:hypothetical protein
LKVLSDIMTILENEVKGMTVDEGLAYWLRSYEVNNTSITPYAKKWYL